MPANVTPLHRYRQTKSDHLGESMLASYKLYVRNETKSASTIRIRDHYISRLAADLDVTTATETQLETWLRTQGWAPSSMNSALASIRHFYRWAERYNHIPNNPTRWLRRARVPRRMGRIAADDKIRDAAMRAPPSPPAS